MASNPAPPVSWTLGVLAALLGIGAHATTAAHGASAGAAADIKPEAKPQVGTFGFDAAGMDRSIKPGDDFLEYAGGTYLRGVQLPEDQASYGVYNSIGIWCRRRG